MFFVIPEWVMVTLMIVLWIAVAYLFWIKPRVQPKIQDYFALRRHNRRMRNRKASEDGYTLQPYAQRDIDMTLKLMKAMPYHERLIKDVPRATARHRR